MDSIYQYKPLKERRDTPLVPNNSDSAKVDDKDSFLSKRNIACRSGNTGDRPERMSLHSVFVLSNEGKPLTPTTAAKARKLLKYGQAEKVWSKFNTFGIRMLVETRKETPKTSLGHDPGAKYEGYSIVCGNENSLNIKLDLPEKWKIVKKMKERAILRRKRRQRKCRKRPVRFNNRNRRGFIAPSQIMIICSRLKILKELIKLYKISVAGLEDIKFNHTKNKFGKNFTIMEIGKNIIRDFIRSKDIQIKEFTGVQTKQLREKYKYTKSEDKSANIFTSHCSDSLSLAIEVNNQYNIPHYNFIVVNDTYRYNRRILHDCQYSKNNIRYSYNKRLPLGMKKGRIIGLNKQIIGYLCGIKKSGYYRYYDINIQKRREIKNIHFIKNQFITKG